MMKLDGRFCRLMCAVLCAVMLAGLLPVSVPFAYADEAAVYGRVTADEVFFRYSASKSSDWKFKMALNTIVEITKDKDANGWYGIKVAEPGQSYPSTGYCSATYLEVMTAEDVDAWLQAGAPAVFAPSSDAPGSDDPDDTEGSDDPDIKGYVTIIEKYHTDGVNLRDGVDGDIELVWKLSDYAALPYTEKLSSNWYKVLYGDAVYYVNGTVVEESDSEGNTDDDADSGDDSDASGDDEYSGTYVKIRSGYKSVNLRQSAGGTYRGMWKASEYKVLPYYGTPVYKNGYNWYPVEYQSKTYYVTGQFVVECDKDGKVIESGTSTPVVPDEDDDTDSTPVISVGTIRLTADKVIFRKTPGGAMIRRLAKGTLMPFDGTKTADGFTWFNAEASDGKKGWIREDVCDVIDGTYTEDGIVVGELVTIKGGVNLRKSAAGTSMQQLAKGITMPILDNIDGTDGGSYDWFKVKAPDGTIGYVRSDCVKITSTGDGSGSDSESDSTPSSGYVMITANKVKLRKSAAGSFLKYLNDKEVYPLAGKATDKSGYTWYPIKVDSTVGYVRNDFSMVLNDEQTEAYLKGDPIPSATPKPTGDLASDYLITNDNVNLRESASTESDKLFVVDKGVVMGSCGKQTVGGVDWYKAVYKNTYIWVMAKYVDVMTNDEYKQWLENNPDAEKPSTEVIAGYVKTTSGGLNLREEAGGTVITRLSKGLVLPYETAVYHGNDLWYKVKSPSNGWGYIIEDYLKLTDKNGTVLPDATPDISVGGGTTSDGKQEASYTTLRKGSSGSDVKKMVTELKAQGYWTGDVTSTYSTSVVEAVKKFQKAKGLDVDGIAGPNTLHALYGTVPVGSGSGMPGMNIYPVEKIDWWTGGIQKLWPKGKDVVVMDVKTGYTFWCHRWSGGNHADVEPLTAADTATICRMYGVSSAEQIEKKNLWQRRPLWITIGNRTFAASMFGFAHNYPDGDTISTNNFKGQFCIHFTNSTIHRTDVICEYHQAAINEAYKKAPSRK